MGRRNLPSGVDRRRFLKRVGVGTGVILSGQLVSPLSLFADDHRGKRIRVGILHNNSNAAANISQSVLDGADVFNAMQSNTTVIPVLTQFSGGRSSCVEAFENLASAHGVDVVIGIANHGITDAIAPLAARHRLPYIEFGAGERCSAPNEQSAYVYRSSLGMWQAAFAADNSLLRLVEHEVP